MTEDEYDEYEDIFDNVKMYSMSNNEKITFKFKKYSKYIFNKIINKKTIGLAIIGVLTLNKKTIGLAIIGVLTFKAYKS